MRYDPLTYWKQRSNITPYGVPKRVKDYIRDKIEDAETILDFGCGNGRLLPVFADKNVTGYDIVGRTPPYPTTDTLEGEYDAIIASKVFLHIPKNQIGETIEILKRMSSRIVVWDAKWQDAFHTFDHDFSKYGTMKDVQQWDNQLLFCYED